MVTSNLAKNLKVDLIRVIMKFDWTYKGVQPLGDRCYCRRHGEEKYLHSVNRVTMSHTRQGKSHQTIDPSFLVFLILIFF